jgi:signal transduction histidine kinase
VTVYDARRPRRLRPTLRLRLTLLNGILVVVAGAVLVLLSFMVVGSALEPADRVRPGTRVTLADGRVVDAAAWQGGLVRSAERELLLRGLAALTLIGAAGAAGAYLVAGRALRPLHQVTATARRLSGETLDERIRYEDADDEIAELAATFDAMLDRIAVAFESQKRFVANASHELRTPLAVILTEIDVTTADADADVAEFRRMCTVVRDASVRANALVESLLLLARTEAQAGRRLVRKIPADLSAGVAAALSSVRAEAERLSLTIRTDVGPAAVVGDPSLLDRLAGNLIENAVRYNFLGGRLWVRTGSDDAYAWLVVGNTGFEVEPADVPALFEPFRRGGRERTGARGSGLGLSIVRAICEAHGGSVTATALDGGGLEVTVRLPAAATTPVLAGSASVAPARP